MTTQAGYCPNCGKQREGAMRFCSSCGHDFWAAAAGAASAPMATSTAPPPAPVGAPPQASEASGVPLPTILVLGGGVLLVVGSFLPWATASTVFGSLSRSGVDGGDGWITTIIGALILLFGAMTLRQASRGLNLLIAVGAAIAFLIFVFDLVDVNNRIASIEAEGQGLALGTVGFGLWLVGLGAIVAFFASFFRRRWHQQPATRNVGTTEVR